MPHQRTVLYHITLYTMVLDQMVFHSIAKGIGAYEGTTVPKVGVEPTRISPHDFESCASAGSATSANLWLRCCHSILLECIIVKYEARFCVLNF
jgi:hypothetical protein